MSSLKSKVKTEYGKSFGHIANSYQKVNHREVEHIRKCCPINSSPLYAQAKQWATFPLELGTMGKGQSMSEGGGDTPRWC